MKEPISKTIWGMKCPVCHGDVEYRNNKAYCTSCGIEVCDDDIEKKGTQDKF